VRQNQRPAPALTGHFPEHHAFLLGMMVDRVDALTAQIDTLAIRIEKAIAPFAAQVAELDEIPGIGITTAQEILAETGTDMSRFPTPGHLVSWAKFAPKARQSAARSKAAAPARATPGSAAPSAKPRRRPNQHLPGRPLQAGRQAPRNKRALVAVGNSILIICTCSPIPAPTSPTSARTGTTARTPAAQTPAHRRTRNAYPARESPSTTPPDNPRLRPHR
jgi:transposase